MSSILRPLAVFKPEPIGENLVLLCHQRETIEMIKSSGANNFGVKVINCRHLNTNFNNYLYQGCQ